MHPRPAPPPSRLNKTSKYTLVACLSVACLSVRLSPTPATCLPAFLPPIFLVPACSSLGLLPLPLSPAQNFKIYTCRLSICLSSCRLTACGLPARLPAAYLLGTCLPAYSSLSLLPPPPLACTKPQMYTCRLSICRLSVCPPPCRLSSPYLFSC
jgi:hypothetical protein